MKYCKSKVVKGSILNISEMRADFKGQRGSKFNYNYSQHNAGRNYHKSAMSAVN